MDKGRSDGECKEMIPAWRNGVLAPVEKLEVHRRGLLHKAVSVFLLSGSQVLIQRRALGKYHTPGLWANACCTHPRWDEAAEACAHRRLAEELGLSGLPLEHRGDLTYRADVGGGMVEHERVDIFVGRCDHPLAPEPDPDEVMATRWIELTELISQTRRAPARFTPWLRIYLERHAEQILA